MLTAADSNFLVSSLEAMMNDHLYNLKEWIFLIALRRLLTSFDRNKSVYISILTLYVSAIIQGPK
jgi:hypothetical protein